MSWLGWLIIAGIIYFAWKQFVQPGMKEGMGTPPPPRDNPLQGPLRDLTEAMNKCTAQHDEAVSSLIFMAASDGTVSRQELRIIIGFCERQGTVLGKAWVGACDHLNAGLKLSITGGESGARDNIAALSAKPVGYRAAFLGAAEAIVASNKTTNAAKRRLLEQARGLV